MRMRIAGVAVAVLLLASCAATPASTPTAPATDWSAARQAFLDAYGDLPPSVPYTDAEAADALSTEADAAWSQVSTRFADAVRPTEGFVHWATDDDRTSPTGDLATCLSTHDVQVDTGTDGAGATTIGWGTDDTAESWVGQFFCTEVAYPARPKPPLDAAQLGYFYDYLVGFVAPCLEANGHKVPPVISRDDFVSEYPDQGWFPWNLIDGDGGGVYKICPTEPEIDHSS
jgi:hypothetical protein